MTNHFGLKTISVFCVPVLFRIIRRAKRENILLDVVKRVVQLNNCKHDIRNSKRSFPYSFCRIRTRDPQYIKERNLFYNFRLISRESQNSEFMFLENESELCECRVNLFSAVKVTPTCLVLYTDYHIL